MNSGLKGDTTLKVTNDIFKKIDQDSPRFLASAIKNVKQAFYTPGWEKPPIKTFATYLATTVVYSVFKKGRKFRFLTQGIEYAHDPYDGTYTSERYGPRPWLEIGAIKSLEEWT